MAIKIFSGKLAKDTLVLFVMINIFNVMNFVYHFILARMLTPADYGVLVTLFSLIYIFGVPSEAIQIIYCRLTSGYVVEEKKGKIRSLVRKGLKKGFIVSSILFIFLIILSIFISRFLDIDFWLIFITDIMVFFFILAPIPRGVLQGKKKFGLFGASLVVESVFRLGLSILFVYLGYKIFGAIVGVLIGVAFGFLASMLFIRDINLEKEEKNNFDGIYKFSIPFFITTLVIFVMLSIDVILARRFFTPDVAGKYAVLSTLGKIIFFGTAAVGKTMFPSTSEKFDKKKDTSKLFIKSFGLIVILCLLAVLFYLIIPETIILVAFGQKYLEVAPLLWYSGLAITFLSISNLVLLYGLAIDRLRKPYVLVVFLLVEIVILSVFNSSLKEYIIGLVVSNLIMLFGSIYLVKGKKRAKEHE